MHMFASFCFDHILFWQAIRMCACVGLSRFSIPLRNPCADSSGFIPFPFTFFYGNNLWLTLLSLFHQNCSLLTTEDSPRCPFVWLWVGGAPFLSPLPLGEMSSPAQAAGPHCPARPAVAPQPVVVHAHTHTLWGRWAGPAPKVVFRKSS